ncbi:hypothetical protein GOP47_0027777 [Adiantum capillus-veneris]|nr:hypothetical protein GOP47_0027777 [Adiantum capillus-veneris]
MNLVLVFVTETEDPESLLIELIYDSKSLEDYDIYYKMFNTPLDVAKVLSFHSSFLEEQALDYERLVKAREVTYVTEVYVHAIDLIKDFLSATSRLNKKYAAIPENSKLILLHCPKCKHKCELLKRNEGFLVYLFLIRDDEGELEEEETDSAIIGEVNEDVEVEEELNMLSEEHESEKLDLAIIRSDTKIFESLSKPMEHLPVPILPTFPLNECEYVLLTDVQRAFNLREDEMFVILAQRWNFNVGIDDEPIKYKDFVEQESTFQTLETCFNSAKALRICFNKAFEYCEPTKEEFLLAQQTIKDPHSPNEKDNDAESRGSQVTIPIVEDPQD